MARKISTEIWVSELSAAHREKYDYSNSVYKSAHTKVEIMCPEHGSFWQAPNSHKGGCGCPICGIASRASKQRSDIEAFKKSASDVWGDTYEYTNTAYVNYHTCVDVICKTHGTFKTTPANHLRGKGCRKCATENISENRTREQFSVIEQAAIVHDHKYDYSEVVYTRMRNRVDIICPKHGKFQQTMSAHVRGCGCLTCAKESRIDFQKGSAEDFIAKAVLKKGNLYDYSKVVYTSSTTPVEIICRKHNSFMQTPGNHLNGQGCPSCALTGYSNAAEGSFYIMECADIVKVGITNKSPNLRAKQISKSSKMTFTVLADYRFSDGRVPRTVETRVLTWLRSIYTPVTQLFDGSTECFVEVDKARLINFVLSELPQP